MLGLQVRPDLSPHDFMALTALGMVTVWVGGFVTFFGLRATRIALFPLSFLIFIIPLPEALLFRIITALQYASADVVALLFQLCPFPFTREGVYFTLPGLSIEVARECSSIRSSMALCMACVLANHLLLRRWWSKAVVLLLVFPLAVLKNGVRIATLCTLTLYVDKGFLEGDLHSRGGVVFFGLALAMLLPTFLGLRKIESWHAGSGQEHEGSTERKDKHHGSISDQENCA
jgi:exosortase